ncbi:MAG: type II toxin-antitoxin system VapC family toxin [Gemmatimonadaceae bacterium]
MIVVDTNVIAYLLLPGDQTEAARGALARDAAWVAPFLWRSELRNVLRGYMRQGHLTLAKAREVQGAAEDLMSGREFPVESADVLALAAASGQSAYDCEFVSLARALDIQLVTSDQEVLANFPANAVSLKTFGSGEPAA